MAQVRAAAFPLNLAMLRDSLSSMHEIVQADLKLLCCRSRLDLFPSVLNNVPLTADFRIQSAIVGALKEQM